MDSDFSVVQFPSLQLKLCTTYGLSRERDIKKIEHDWISNAQDLQTNVTLSEFLSSNIAALFNMKETQMLKGDARAPAITFLPMDGRRERNRCYICDFEEPKKLALLDKLKDTGDETTFHALSRLVANLFRESPFWPMQYLFVCQWTLALPNGTTHNCISILTTKLERGRLAEDEKHIVTQLQQGIMGDTVKKGILYPHFADDDGEIVSESKAKVYESKPGPAQYFYDFLKLKQPMSIDELVEESYKSLASSGRSSLEELGKSLGPDILRNGHAIIFIDGKPTKVTLEDLVHRIRFADTGSAKVVLIKGSVIRVGIGTHDLLQEGAIKVMSKKELLQYIIKES